jgi:hypothetical protein
MPRTEQRSPEGFQPVLSSDASRIQTSNQLSLNRSHRNFVTNVSDDIGLCAPILSKFGIGTEYTTPYGLPDASSHGRTQHHQSRRRCNLEPEVEGQEQWEEVLRS